MISFRGTIPITIYPMFFVMAFLIALINTQEPLSIFIWMVVITLSVLVHELGHALTAKSFGQVVKIDLVGFGGLTQHTGKTLSAWQQFLVVMNGPLAGFSLYGLAELIRERFSPTGTLGYAVMIVALVNFVWTVLNLLPIQPLDGGKLLLVIFEKLFGHRGIKLSYLSSIVIGAIFSVFAFALGMLLAGAIFLFFSFESYRAWTFIRNLQAEDRDTNLQKLLELAREHFHVGRMSEAKRELEELLQKAKTGVLHGTAVELLALVYVQEGRDLDAFTLLQSAEVSLTAPALLLLQRLSCKLGEWDISLKVGEKLYPLMPTVETALLNASTRAHFQDSQATLGWLRRAKIDGATNLRDYVARPEFDAIRPSLLENSSLFN